MIQVTVVRRALQLLFKYREQRTTAQNHHHTFSGDTIMFNATTASLAQLRAFAADHNIAIISEERRVGKDCISRWSPYN